MEHTQDRKCHDIILVVELRRHLSNIRCRPAIDAEVADVMRAAEVSYP
jgi:hypothetical protein